MSGSEISSAGVPNAEMCVGAGRAGLNACSSSDPAFTELQRVALWILNLI